MIFKESKVELVELNDDYKSFISFINTVCSALGYKDEDVKEDYTSFAMQFLKEPDSFNRWSRDIRRHIYAPICKEYKKTDEKHTIKESECFKFDKENHLTYGVYEYYLYPKAFSVKKFYNVSTVKEKIGVYAFPYTFKIKSSMATLLRLATDAALHYAAFSYHIDEEEAVCTLPEWLVGVTQTKEFKSSDLTPERIRELMKDDSTIGVAIGVASLFISTESIIKELKEADVTFDESYKLYPMNHEVTSIVTASLGAWKAWSSRISMMPYIGDTELITIQKEIDKVINKEIIDTHNNKYEI